MRYIFQNGKCPTKCVSRQYKCGTEMYRISRKNEGRLRYKKTHLDKEKIGREGVHGEHINGKMGQNRSRKITARVSPEEYLIIENDASEKGMQLSEYVRFRLLAKTGHSVYDKENLRSIQNLNREINRIGNNINQIAHRHNADLYAPGDMDEMISLLARCESLIIEYIDTME